MMIISIDVRGTPKPQGSKVAFMRPGAKYPTMIESAGKPLKVWRKQVSAEAKAAMDGRSPMVGPVTVAIQFFLLRPKSHYRTGKHAGRLKAWSITATPDRRPDIDKLVRAVLDGLSKSVYVDDSQVCDLQASKHYADGPSYASITVESA